MTRSAIRGYSPNDFKGSDIERIQQAVDAAAAGDGRVVIPRMNRCGQASRDYWLIDSAIRLPSNLTLELDQCRIKLSDRCRDNFIRSANCGLGKTEIAPAENIRIVGRGNAVLEGADRPRSTGDSAKTLGKRTFGTDAGVAGESQTGDWRNIGILIARVEHFCIANVRMVNSHCWGISLEHCAHGRLDHIDFASSGFMIVDGTSRTVLNQDGIDLRVGCHDITIEDVTGYTGDDLVALTAIPFYPEVAGSLNATQGTGANAWAGRCDDIAQVTIRNVRGYCRGGHHIIRFLNTSGIRLHDIILDSVMDTSPPGIQSFATVKIGDNCPAWGGVTPLGDTFHFLISNIISRSREAILIAGSLSESMIHHVIKSQAPGDPVVLQSGNEYIRNVKMTDLAGGY